MAYGCKWHEASQSNVSHNYLLSEVRFLKRRSLSVLAHYRGFNSRFSLRTVIYSSLRDYLAGNWEKIAKWPPGSLAITSFASYGVSWRP